MDKHKIISNYFAKGTKLIEKSIKRSSGVRCAYPDCDSDGIYLVDGKNSWICEAHAETANLK